MRCTLKNITTLYHLKFTKLIKLQAAKSLLLLDSIASSNQFLPKHISFQVVFNTLLFLIDLINQFVDGQMSDGI